MHRFFRLQIGIAFLASANRRTIAQCPFAFSSRTTEIEKHQELGCFADAVTSIIDPGEGTIIWSVADWDKVNACYVHGESLLWRDAGALLGVLYLVCGGLGLNCCAVGMTGDPMISR